MGASRLKAIVQKGSTRYVVVDPSGRIIHASPKVRSLKQHWEARKTIEKFMNEIHHKVTS